MAKKSTITCLCSIEVTDTNEYEALTEVDEMLGREYPLSDRTTLIVRETITTSSEGCGVIYKKEEKNGNVRRDNCSEVLSEELIDEGKREAVA